MLVQVEWTDRLLPANTEDWYVSYPAGSGRRYLHVEGTYTNTGTKVVFIGQLPVPEAEQDRVTLGSGFVVVDAGDNSFADDAAEIACAPGETCHYHGLILCPAELAQSSAPLSVTMALSGVVYRYDLR